MSIFKKLFKTRNKIGGVLSGIFKSSKISSEDYEKIEECLLSADISWSVTEKIIDSIKKQSNQTDWEETLKTVFRNILSTDTSFQLKKNITGYPNQKAFKYLLTDVDDQEIEFKIADCTSFIDYNFDIVLANINRSVIVDIIPNLSSSNTLVFLSGILNSDEDLISDLLNQYNRKIQKIYRKNKWSCIVIK